MKISSQQTRIIHDFFFFFYCFLNGGEKKFEYCSEFVYETNYFVHQEKRKCNNVKEKKNNRREN